MAAERNAQNNTEDVREDLREVYIGLTLEAFRPLAATTPITQLEQILPRIDWDDDLLDRDILGDAGARPTNRFILIRHYMEFYSSTTNFRRMLDIVLHFETFFMPRVRITLQRNRILQDYRILLLLEGLYRIRASRNYYQSVVSYYEEHNVDSDEQE